MLGIAFSRIRFIPSYNPYLLQLIQKIIHEELRKIVAVHSQIFLGIEQHQFLLYLIFLGELLLLMAQSRPCARG